MLAPQNNLDHICFKKQPRKSQFCVVIWNSCFFLYFGGGSGRPAFRACFFRHLGNTLANRWWLVFFACFAHACAFGPHHDRHLSPKHLWGCIGFKRGNPADRKEAQAAIPNTTKRPQSSSNTNKQHVFIKTQNSVQTKKCKPESSYSGSG